jgi:hypothetical protein
MVRNCTLFNLCDGPSIGTRFDNISLSQFIVNNVSDIIQLNISLICQSIFVKIKIKVCILDGEGSISKKNNFFFFLIT